MHRGGLPEGVDSARQRDQDIGEPRTCLNFVVVRDVTTRAFGVVCDMVDEFGETLRIVFLASPVFSFLASKLL